MKQCPTRDRILAYILEHPVATYRQIATACKISSTSVVAHHIKVTERTCCSMCGATLKVKKLKEKETSP